MTYLQAIKEQCERYAKENNGIFIGYNTVFGSRMYGTLSDVPAHNCIESPVAENLMVGMAVGMALEGYRPVVCFERHDFLLLGLDALVNHIDKLPWLSGDQFKLPIIIRAIVGSKSPINPGPMHCQDYTLALVASLKHTKIFLASSKENMNRAWSQVGKTDSGAVVIIEYKDDYKKEMPETIQ